MKSSGYEEQYTTVENYNNQPVEIEPVDLLPSQDAYSGDALHSLPIASQR